MASKTLAFPGSSNPTKQQPAVGFGTWQAKPGEVEKAVETALRAGYKHLDCAAIYGNEKEVGTGLKNSGVNRDDIFITSKLWNNAHHPDYVQAALDKTLSDLGVSYLDLYLIHWPSAFKPGGENMPKENGIMIRDRETTLAQTWAEMEKAFESGKVKAIGISNFTKSEIEEVLRTAKHKPDCIQIELHPYLQQQAFVDWLHSQGIAVTAYSPLGGQNPTYGTQDLVRDDPVIKEIAQKHGKTATQIVLSWGATRDTAVIPKSTNEGRIKENLDVILLPQEDMQKIASIDKNTRYNDASTSFQYVFFADEKPAYQSALHAITNAGAQAKAALQGAVNAATA